MLKVTETFPYEFTMGKKVIKFRSWKTKDEKNYLILLESKEDITDEDLFNSLLYPCLENKDIYLNDAEIQRLLIEIRSKSLGETFDIKFVCKNESCKAVNDSTVDFKKIVDFKDDNVTNIKIDNIEFFFGEIKNKKALMDRTKDKTVIEVNYIEMLMRIEKLIIDDNLEDTFTFEELMDYVDNLDSNTFDKLMAYYIENRSTLNLVGEVKCFRCGTENKFVFDEIPNFLAGW